MNEEEKQKLEALYKTINEMMAYLGAEGEIDTRNPLVGGVMDALYGIDEGFYDENRFKQFMKNLVANRSQRHLSL